MPGSILDVPQLLRPSVAAVDAETRHACGRAGLWLLESTRGSRRMPLRPVGH